MLGVEASHWKMLPWWGKDPMALYAALFAEYKALGLDCVSMFGVDDFYPAAVSLLPEGFEIVPLFNKLSYRQRTREGITWKDYFNLSRQHTNDLPALKEALDKITVDTPYLVGSMTARAWAQAESLKAMNLVPKHQLLADDLWRETEGDHHLGRQRLKELMPDTEQWVTVTTGGRGFYLDGIGRAPLPEVVVLQCYVQGSNPIEGLLRTEQCIAAGVAAQEKHGIKVGLFLPAVPDWDVRPGYTFLCLKQAVEAGLTGPLMLYEYTGLHDPAVISASLSDGAALPEALEKARLPLAREVAAFRRFMNGEGVGIDEMLGKEA